MNALGQYILSVGLAALFVGILTSISDSKSSSGVLLRMVCGLFLAFVLIKTVGNLDYGSLEAFARSYTQEADEAVEYGADIAAGSIRELIKEETEAYILDKARTCQCAVQVQVTVSREDPPVPESVRLTGTVTANGRKTLEKILEEELGIPKERQQWIGQQ